LDFKRAQRFDYKSSGCGACVDFDSQTAGRELLLGLSTIFRIGMYDVHVDVFGRDKPCYGALAHECLVTLTKPLAPMVPFIAEHTWQELVRIANPAVESSVHLADFFRLLMQLQINVVLNEHAAMTRRVVELGRSASTSRVWNQNPSTLSEPSFLRKDGQAPACTGRDEVTVDR
jgi:hypothetical protein